MDGRSRAVQRLRGHPELLHVTIGDDGVPKETARSKVLPEDFVSTRKVTWASKANKALLVSENGDVYVFDFSNGLPQEGVKPIGNAGQDSGRFSENVINADATRLAIAYTDTAIHPDSARGGSLVKIDLSDATTFAPVKSLTLADLGLTDIKSMTFSVDGARSTCSVPDLRSKAPLRRRSWVTTRAPASRSVPSMSRATSGMSAG